MPEERGPDFQAEQSRSWGCKLAFLARSSHTEHLKMTRLAGSLEMQGQFLLLRLENTFIFVS